MWILPPSANTFVPGLFSVPMLRNHAGPLRKICGIFAYVSTLLRTVGFWKRPLSAGNGGRGLDSVCFAAPIFFHVVRYWWTP